MPRQLIKKYTKTDDIILDLFLGSGTTAYEAEALGRNLIGVDIVPEMISHVESKIDKQKKYFYELLVGDSMSQEINMNVKSILQAHKRKNVQLVILHPPYADIIKFSGNKNDLSNARHLAEFIAMFSNVLKNSYDLLESNRYLAIVIGDTYKNSEWVPLGFYCMQSAQKLGFKLKSIVVKNMTGNRGKQNKENIWRYRALAIA